MAKCVHTVEVVNILAVACQGCGNYIFGNRCFCRIRIFAVGNKQLSFRIDKHKSVAVCAQVIIKHTCNKHQRLIAFINIIQTAFADPEIVKKFRHTVNGCKRRAGFEIDGVANQRIHCRRCNTLGLLAFFGVIGAAVKKGEKNFGQVCIELDCIGIDARCNFSKLGRPAVRGDVKIVGVVKHCQIIDLFAAFGNGNGHTARADVLLFAVMPDANRVGACLIAVAVHNKFAVGRQCKCAADISTVFSDGSAFTGLDVIKAKCGSCINIKKR